MKAGEGFALFVNPYREELTYRDQEDLYIPEDNLIRHEVGLRRLNGVLEWPYFDATTNLAGDIQRYGHRNHIYRANEKKSYFFNYLNDDLSLILDESFGVNRTEKAYKLNTSATITTSIVPIRGSDNHYFAMVGNPYMSTIDFDKFWADNSSKLKATKGYYVYIDGELEEEDTQRLGAFATYNNPSAYPYANNNRIDKYIAPMQAFIVELANGSVNALDFKIADISVAHPIGI